LNEDQSMWISPLIVGIIYNIILNSGLEKQVLHYQIYLMIGWKNKYYNIYLWEIIKYQ